MRSMAAQAAPIKKTEPFDPLRWTTRLVLGVLFLTIALDVVAVVSDLSYHSLIERLSNGGDVSPAKIQCADDRQSTIGWVQTGIFVIAAIFFITWFSRAYKNLGRLGVEALRWREGWAIGAWFVPFLNFVRPKAIANDIWRGSDPQRQPRTDLLEDTSVPWYFDVWWGLFIVGWIFSASRFCTIRTQRRSRACLRQRSCWWPRTHSMPSLPSSRPPLSTKRSIGSAHEHASSPIGRPKTRRLQPPCAGRKSG
jgi:Domain of unknown function (DUF4328)